MIWGAALRGRPNRSMAGVVRTIGAATSAAPNRALMSNNFKHPLY